MAGAALVDAKAKPVAVQGAEVDIQDPRVGILVVRRGECTNRVTRTVGRRVPGDCLTLQLGGASSAVRGTTLNKQSPSPRLISPSQEPS